MLTTAQRAFGISTERHFRLLHAASEEKPKVIVLSVIVQEAEGLEAKDANGKNLLLNVLLDSFCFHRVSKTSFLCNMR
jgi:putative lipase involved disintegration of autophagic bodies